MSQRSPPDLPNTAWTVLTPLIPAATPGGRPRTTDMRAVVKAICYMLRGGCHWRLLPTDFPPPQTVDHSFRTWRRAGVWERRHDPRRGDLHEAAGRTRAPSAGIIDSQPVQTTENGGAGALTEASAYAVARATSGSMSWGCSSSSWGMLLGSKTAMGPNRCSGHS
jgi:putative transposase